MEARISQFEKRKKTEFAQIRPTNQPDGTPELSDDLYNEAEAALRVGLYEALIARRLSSSFPFSTRRENV
jgi:hypothetical protein